MKIFEIAAIYVPTEDKETKTKEKAEIIVAPTSVLAKDQATASMLAARLVPDKFADRLDQVQVAVRPF